VQFRQDQFDAGHFLFGMHIHRHAAPVVRDLHRAVVIGDDVDPPRMAGQCLVHAVVDDFHREMIWPRGVRVHARPSLDRFESGQDFDVFCTI